MLDFRLLRLGHANYIIVLISRELVTIQIKIGLILLPIISSNTTLLDSEDAYIHTCIQFTNNIQI